MHGRIVFLPRRSSPTAFERLRAAVRVGGR
ncbi:hypothetical protein J2Z78_002492 [Streptomyces griseorubens]